VVERNAYLIKRYGWWELAFFIWTVANTLTIVFIAKGVQAAGGHLDVDRATTTLLIGAVIWSYLGIIFEILTETVAWERWEGHDRVHVHGAAPARRAPARHGPVRGALRRRPHGAPLRGRGAVLRPALPGRGLRRRAAAARRLVAVRSSAWEWSPPSCADLPREGAQLGFIARAILLVVSGVYYRLSVMPQWMQWLSTISPATYALRGHRPRRAGRPRRRRLVGRHLAAAAARAPWRSRWDCWSSGRASGTRSGTGS